MVRIKTAHAYPGQGTNLRDAYVVSGG